MIPAADLASLYEHFTVQATVGAVTAPVHFRQGDGDVLGGARISREYRMRYPVASFPAIARGSAVTISATSYRVTEIRQFDSGVEAEARLEKV